MALQTQRVLNQTVRSLASISGWSMPSSRSLWDIIKREHIEGHDVRHIRDIWLEFHSDPAKSRVATVLTVPQYFAFEESAATKRVMQIPMFILPVFRGPNAFENFLLQCQTPYVLLTSLEDFKRNGSYTAPHLVLTHYTELIDTKGVVLVRGDILQPHALDMIQAASLMHNCHEYYSDRGAKGAFVTAFNHRPSEFDMKRLLDSMGHDTSQLPQ